jgi:hypothetical protein
MEEHIYKLMKGNVVMINRVYISSFAWLCAVVSGLFVCTDIKAQDSAKDEELRASLEEVRGRIMQASEETLKMNHTYLRVKDRIVYSNDTVNVLYKETKELEKKLNEKRKILDEEILKVAEIREVMKARNDAFAILRKIKDEEAAILKEIKSREVRAAFDKKKDEAAGSQ